MKRGARILTNNSSTVPIDTSLGTYLRYHAQLKGTKFMCREGGCGACIVNVSGQHPVTKDVISRAVNSVRYHSGQSLSYHC